MARKRKRKPGGPLWRGPFTYDHLKQAIESLGFEPAKGTKHPAWKHPNRGGKVNLAKKWDSVRKGSVVFDSVADQAGVTPDELLELLQDVSR